MTSRILVIPMVNLDRVNILSCCCNIDIPVEGMIYLQSEYPNELYMVAKSEVVQEYYFLLYLLSIGDDCIFGASSVNTDYTP